MRAKPNANIVMECVLKIDINHAREAPKSNIVMKCMLKIDISHARESLKCENRYEMRANNQY